MHHVPNDPIFSKDEYEIQLLLHKPKFQKVVLTLRKKWKIPEDGLTHAKLHSAWHKQLRENGIREYDRDVSLLIQLLDVTERMHDGISSYIQTNAPATLKKQSYNPVKVEYYGDPEEGFIRSIHIEIDKETTQREVLEAFRDAQAMLGVTEDKKQRPKNQDRDIEVLQKHYHGQKDAEIANWLNSDSKYDQVFDSSDVNKIIKRIKERLL